MKNLFKSNQLLLCLILTFIIGCSSEKGNELYISIYGTYKANSVIVLRVNGEEVYQQKTTVSKFMEKRLPVLFVNKKHTTISLKVNGKDTTFSYSLGKKNYLNLAYSTFQRQFQVVKVDSLSFRQSSDDVVCY